MFHLSISAVSTKFLSFTLTYGHGEGQRYDNWRIETSLKELMIQSILFVVSVLQVIYFGSLSRTVSEAYYSCVFVDVHAKYISYCLQFERAVARERRGSRWAVERASRAIRGFFRSCVRWREQEEGGGESKKSNGIESGERCNVYRKHSRKLQKQVQTQIEMHQVLIWVNKTISLIQPISSCYLRHISSGSVCSFNLFFLFYIKVLVTDNDRGMTFGEVKQVWRSWWSKGYFLHFLITSISYISCTTSSYLFPVFPVFWIAKHWKHTTLYFCWCTHKICLLLCLHFSDAQQDVRLKDVWCLGEQDLRCPPSEVII